MVLEATMIWWVKIIFQKPNPNQPCAWASINHSLLVSIIPNGWETEILLLIDLTHKRKLYIWLQEARLSQIQKAMSVLFQWLVASTFKYYYYDFFGIIGGSGNLEIYSHYFSKIRKTFRLRAKLFLAYNLINISNNMLIRIFYDPVSTY